MRSASSAVAAIWGSQGLPEQVLGQGLETKLYALENVEQEQAEAVLGLGQEEQAEAVLELGQGWLEGIGSCMMGIGLYLSSDSVSVSIHSAST